VHRCCGRFLVFGTFHHSNFLASNHVLINLPGAPAEKRALQDGHLYVDIVGIEGEEEDRDYREGD
jgi:hypothetical protein